MAPEREGAHAPSTLSREEVNALVTARMALADIVRRTAGGGAEERRLQRLAGKAHDALREVLEDVAG